MEEFNLQVRCLQCKTVNLVDIPTSVPASFKCSACGEPLLECSPIRGFIYVLSNAMMPQLYKIGFTTRPVMERIAEFNSATAVPSAFVVEAVFASGNPGVHEAEIHQRLAATRLPGKEFFRDNLTNILRVAEEVCGLQAKYLRACNKITIAI